MTREKFKEFYLIEVLNEMPTVCVSFDRKHKSKILII